VLFALVPGFAYPSHISKEAMKKLVDRCEAAREARLAPLREKQIQDCMASAREQRIRPEDCREYFRDFGDARNTGHGVVPRMFHNIPECSEAEEAQRHFNLLPP
jgi:hypothetical protein